MPLPRWLKSLIHPKSAQTSARPPPSGEGWGGGADPAHSTPPEPYDSATYSPSQAYLDHSHRIHIAANDPAFPAKREAAVALICQAITDIATPLGYTRKGTTWSRDTPQGRSAINLQRSRYGFSAQITLRFLRPDGTSLDTGLWAQEEDISLQHFYQPNESEGTDPSDITYMDVSENPATLGLPMHILSTRALPWLDAHHMPGNPSSLESAWPH